MKEYQASKLANGVNKLFPHKVTISDCAVTVIQPGVFSNKEKTIPFSKIASVDVSCPLVGFSTINIETSGNDTLTLVGFLKSEVNEMKDIILKNI